MGSLRTKDNTDEDLALFREMRNQEKYRNTLLPHQNFDKLSPEEMETGNYYISNRPSVAPAQPPVMKTIADDFLNSDHDKNDYEWLLTPPGTPLFPSLEMEARKTLMSQIGTSKAHPTSLKSRLVNPQREPKKSNLSSRQTTSSPGLSTSSAGLRRPSSSGGPGSRAAMPNGRQTVNSQSRSNLLTSTRPSMTTLSKVTANTSSKVATTSVKPWRSATPTSRHTFTSTQPQVPQRSSTPTARSTMRPSTPTSRPSLLPSKSAPRAGTPIRRPTVSSATNTSVASLNSSTSSSSVSKLISSAQKHSASLRPSSPTTRPQPWKPSDMPGFSLDAPPNLRTSLSDRPPSVTRGRPGAPSSRSSSIEPASNARVRHQSCSPARGRPPNVTIYNSGSSVPVSTANRLRAKANECVSPVIVGTKMVERVIHMRKLIPPKQEDKHSPHGNFSRKMSSPDCAGFGRSLSRKSLDMAMRHMDIRTIPGNLRPLKTNIPASSLYSMRSGPNRGRATGLLDSPLATSSNASSEVSVNNNVLCMEGADIDDGTSSHKGMQYSLGR